MIVVNHVKEQEIGRRSRVTQNLSCPDYPYKMLNSLEKVRLADTKVVVTKNQSKAFSTIRPEDGGEEGGERTEEEGLERTVVLLLFARTIFPPLERFQEAEVEGA